MCLKVTHPSKGLLIWDFLAASCAGTFSFGCRCFLAPAASKTLHSQAHFQVHPFRTRPLLLAKEGIPLRRAGVLSYGADLSLSSSDWLTTKWPNTPSPLPSLMEAKA